MSVQYRIIRRSCLALPLIYLLILLIDPVLSAVYLLPRTCLPVFSECLLLPLLYARTAKLLLSVAYTNDTSL